MKRRSLANLATWRYLLAICFGDSLTHNDTYPVRYTQYYPELMAAWLRQSAQGSLPIRAINLGQSGDTSAQMVARMNYAGRFPATLKPALGVVWAGENDPTARALSALTQSGGVATATLTADIGLQTGMQAAIAGASVSAYNGTFTVTRVDATHVTYAVPGGTTSPAGGSPTIGIPSAQTTANIQTLAELQFTLGVKHVFILTTHLQNFVGGDLVSGPALPTPQTLGGQIAPPASPATRFNLWQAQQTAYANLLAAHPGRVWFVNNWGGFYTLLTNNPGQVGTTTYYQVATSNIHLNAFGESEVASFIEAIITANPAITTDLLAI